MFNTIHKSLDLPHKWDADEIHQIIRFWRTKRFLKLQHVGYEWILVPRTEYTGNSAYQREIISLQHISSNIHKLRVKINTPYKLHTKWWGSLKRVRPLKWRCQENHSSKDITVNASLSELCNCCFQSYETLKARTRMIREPSRRNRIRFPTISEGYTKSSKIASWTAVNVRLRGRLAAVPFFGTLKIRLVAISTTSCKPNDIFHNWENKKVSISQW